LEHLQSAALKAASIRIKIMQIIKRITAREFCKYFPESLNQKKLWGSEFWRDAGAIVVMNS
jgi:hypothetical protein